MEFVVFVFTLEEIKEPGLSSFVREELVNSDFKEVVSDLGEEEVVFKLEEEDCKLDEGDVCKLGEEEVDCKLKEEVNCKLGEEGDVCKLEE